MAQGEWGLRRGGGTWGQGKVPTDAQSGRRGSTGQQIPESAKKDRKGGHEPGGKKAFGEKKKKSRLFKKNRTGAKRVRGGGEPSKARFCFLEKKKPIFTGLCPLGGGKRRGSTPLKKSLVKAVKPFPSKKGRGGRGVKPAFSLGGGKMVWAAALETAAGGAQSRPSGIPGVKIRE